MYPVGLGTARRPMSARYPKGQSLSYGTGGSYVKDSSEASLYNQPNPSVLGDNIRQGRSIQMNKGVIQFDPENFTHRSAGPSGPSSSRRPVSARPLSSRTNYTQQTNNTSRPSTARPQSGVPSRPPKWLEYDGLMLVFEGYFKEAVVESAEERVRVRRCVIQYFLEDDSVKILEPREENSGIVQGAFLKRQKVTNGDGTLLHWRDFAVGSDIEVFGRVFRLTDADARTRQWFEEHHCPLGEAGQVPADASRTARSRPGTARASSARPASGNGGDDFKAYAEALQGRHKDDVAAITKFLENDRKVLRFYALWEPRGVGTQGERRELRLHFFLADDTVEVLEPKGGVQGRGAFPTLLKRIKLPKRWAADTRQSADFYSARDFVVGETISVFGRKILLQDCDEFTRQYFADEFGIMQRALTKPASNKVQLRQPVPPHNGIGKEEDALQNCLSLHPQRPKQNVMRQLQNKGKCLRFMARMAGATGFDVERVFTVTYHLDTDTLSIFEPAQRNSGRMSGKFLESTRVKKPGSAFYYKCADMFVGQRLVVSGRTFELLEADLFTVNYMETHADEFPAADPDAIVRKLANEAPSAIDDACDSLAASDPMFTNMASFEGFAEALRQSAGHVLSDGEVITLARSFGTGDMERALLPQSVRYGDLASHIRQVQGTDGTSQTEVNEFDAGNNAFEDSEDGARNAITSVLVRRGMSAPRALLNAVQHQAFPLHGMDDADIPAHALLDVLAYNGVDLTEGQQGALLRAVDPQDKGSVNVGSLVRFICQPLSGARLEVTKKAFSAIDRYMTGVVQLGDIMFRAALRRHPRVAKGELSVEEARREVLSFFEGLLPPRQKEVSRDVFIRVFTEASTAVESDSYFLDWMESVFDVRVRTNAWGR